MDNHNFKVGDEVRVIYNSNGSCIVTAAMNKTGIVKSTYGSRMVLVEFDEVIFSNLSCIGFYKGEIEHVSRKGEQLVFDFMGDN